MGKSEKKWSRVINFSALFIFLFVSIFLIVFGTHSLFSSSTQKILTEISNQKYLEFLSDLGPEYKLGIQMAKSPVIIDYMLNPFDPELDAAAQREIQSYEQSFNSKNSFSIADADLKYHINREVQYVLDKSDATSAWYMPSLTASGDCTLFVDYEKALKRTMLWINAIVRNTSGKGIGLIGTGIELTDFVNGMYAKLPPEYTMFLYNREGIISGALDHSLMEKKSRVTDILPELADMELFPEEVSCVSTVGGEYCFKRLPTVDWMIVLYKPYELGDFFSFAATPFAAVLVLLILLIIFMVIRNLLKPLQSVQSTVEEIASGNADLTCRLSVPKGRSLRVMDKIVFGFNAFIIKLQTIMTSLKDSKTRLVDTGDELKSCTHDTVSSITQIIGNINNMNGSIRSQTESVNQTSSAVNQIFANIDSLNGLISTQVSSVNEASSSVEEMIENINSVNSSVLKLSNSFKKLEENTSLGVTKNREVNEKINLIKSQSEMLQDANQIISSIAEQTNLLAMNAAIEAAHAGDAGRGFSVVADEIRKLSETSSSQSKTIGDQLNAIQNSIGEIVSVSNESQQVLDQVSSGIRDTNEIVRQIEGAMEEQSEGSKHISQALGILNNSSSEVKSSSQEMSLGSKSILSEMEHLQIVSKELEHGMGEMSACAETISDTGCALSSITDAIEASISQIEGEIDTFKV